MRIDVLTIFPEMFPGPLAHSITGRALDDGRFDLQVHDIRSFACGKHRQTDDYPYGGGPGMVMKPGPVFRAVESLPSGGHVILTSPQGRAFNQSRAQQLAAEEHLVIICGRYEGFDERIRDQLVDEELSTGDYVLTGGELPAMTIVDCIVRLLPGVLGQAESAEEDSFSKGLLEGPQYTRPAVFRDLEVPAILLSGHHQRVATWRRRQALLRTYQRRPDLLVRPGPQVVAEDWQWLADQLQGKDAGTETTN